MQTLLRVGELEMDLIGRSVRLARQAAVKTFQKAQADANEARNRTLDLLERSIHVDISPLLDESDVDEIAFAFEKVAAALIR